MSHDSENRQPKLVRDREGYHLNYPVCEIEGENIVIGFDGEKPIVAGRKMDKEEYKNFEITDRQMRMVGITEKNKDFFKSQLPSIPHLNNVFQSKKEDIEKKM